MISNKTSSFKGYQFIQSMENCSLPASITGVVGIVLVIRCMYVVTNSVYYKNRFMRPEGTGKSIQDIFLFV